MIFEVAHLFAPFETNEAAHRRNLSVKIYNHRFVMVSMNREWQLFEAQLSNCHNRIVEPCCSF